MSITFTKDAAKIIFNIMEKQGLNKDEYGINFSLDEDNIQLNFTREITENHQIQHGIKLYTDPKIIEEIVVSTYKSSDGKNGILFLGKNEFKGEL